jgi:hypothetical protein
MKFAYGVSSRGENADAIISNISFCIHIMQLLILGIRIHIHRVIKCGYYSPSVYKIMSVLNYYLNLYARLNNEVITIRKLEYIKILFVTQFTIISHSGI